MSFRSIMNNPPEKRAFEVIRTESRLASPTRLVQWSAYPLSYSSSIFWEEMRRIADLYTRCSVFGPECQTLRVGFFGRHITISFSPFPLVKDHSLDIYLISCGHELPIVTVQKEWEAGLHPLLGSGSLKKSHLPTQLIPLLV